MPRLIRPTPADIENWLVRRAGPGSYFTYDDVGRTRTIAEDGCPEGFVLDHRREMIGQGETDFATAKAALERWQQFQIGWVQALPRDTPIAPSEPIAIVANTFGLWWLNACQIVYVIDEDRRFGFAYGTLAQHMARGEERFLIEFDDDGNVTYDILAFSRPHKLIAKLGYPYVRSLQKKFGQQSVAVMRAAVKAAESNVAP